MATITPTSMTGTGKRAVNATTLTSSDTFTYQPSKNPVLILDNQRGGALTVTIDGAGVTTVPVAGVGDVNVSNGYSTRSIADGGAVAIQLKSISAFLKTPLPAPGRTRITASMLHSRTRSHTR